MSAPETSPANGKQAGRAARPFSIRLTEKERRLLEKMAGGQPLGTYVRDLVLADRSGAARGRGAQDREGLARVLAALGRSGVAARLGEIAKAASIGAIDAMPEMERDISEACKAVVSMRGDLLRALGLDDRG